MSYMRINICIRMISTGFRGHFAGGALMRMDCYWSFNELCIVCVSVNAYARFGACLLMLMRAGVAVIIVRSACGCVEWEIGFGMEWEL
jgi:hypothetical protein